MSDEILNGLQAAETRFFYAYLDSRFADMAAREAWRAARLELNVYRAGMTPEIFRDRVKVAPFAYGAARRKFEKLEMENKK